MHLQSVHLRINDKGTGRPTPCRIRCTDASGNYYAPLGRLTHFATGPNQDVGGNVLVGQEAYAYIDGTCEILLPPGPIRIQVFKGPEYTPLDATFDLAPGKLALRCEIERWSDLRKKGWFPGDGRAHFLSPHAALLEAQAEDLAVVNLLIRPTVGDMPALPLVDAFSGQHPCLENDGHVIVVNSFNSHPQLGGLALLNCHRPVYPLTFGGAASDDWNFAAWCNQCHRKGGLVIWSIPCGAMLGEPLADLLLGLVDAVEIATFQQEIVHTWYTLLNAGLRVPLIGASVKDSNGQMLGAIRTYAKIAEGQDASYSDWIEAVRMGRTFVTRGPILTMNVNGCPPGAVVTAENRVHVVVHARSLRDFSDLEVVHNGHVAARATSHGTPAEAELEVDISVGAGGWLAARCSDAHTSPVYLCPPAQPHWRQAEVLATIDTHLDKLETWIETRGRFEQPKFREQFRDIVAAARRRLHP